MSHRKWKFYDMKVGDVLVILDPPHTLANRIRQYGLQNGKKFTVHKVPGGIEVKRLA